MRSRVAAAAYDYTRKSYEALLQFRTQVLDRVHKLLLIVVVVFGALSYGFAQLVEPGHHSPAWLSVVAGVIGALSCVALAIAFGCALSVLKPGKGAVPFALDACRPKRDSALRGKTEEQLYLDLMQNVYLAYKEMEGDDDARRARYRWFNCFLLSGFIAAVVFLATITAIRCCDVVSSPRPDSTPRRASLASKDTVMPNQPEPTPTPPAQPTSPQPGPPSPNTQPTPAQPDPSVNPLVGPPKLVTANPPPPGLVTKDGAGGTLPTSGDE